MSSSSSPARPSKGILALHGSQNVSCLVDGCNSDLKKCRDYYKRHKVCEFHAKAPIVIVQGMEKRFCQQCSKFHSLDEFDDTKRSCRKRLDGHNRRRRKHQSGSFCFSSRSSYGSNLSSLYSLKTYNQQWLANDLFEGSKWQQVFQNHQHKIGKRASFQICFSQRVNGPANVSSGKERESHESANRSSSSALYLLSTHPKQTTATGFTHNMAPSEAIYPPLHLDAGLPTDPVEEQLLSSQSLIDELMDSVTVLDSKEGNVRVS